MVRGILVMMLVGCGGGAAPVGMSPDVVDDLSFRCTHFKEVAACYALRDAPDLETRAVGLDMACMRHYRDACSLSVPAQYALRNGPLGKVQIALTADTAKEACLVDGDLAMCEYFLTFHEKHPENEPWLATQRPAVEAALAAGRDRTPTGPR